MRLPWLLAAGVLTVALEQRWEARTRREIADAPAGPPPPLMARWMARATVPRDAAARVYARHFGTEIRLSRRFAFTVLGVLGAAEAAVPAGPLKALVAAGLAVTPFTKLVAKPLFNEVEAALPIVGPLSMLREEEVVWALAAETAEDPLAKPWRDCAARLATLPVPQRARAVASRLPLDPPRPALFLEREAQCQRGRERAQQRALGGLLGAAAVALIWRFWIR